MEGDLRKWRHFRAEKTHTDRERERKIERCFYSAESLNPDEFDLTNGVVTRKQWLVCAVAPFYSFEMTKLTFGRLLFNAAEKLYTALGQSGPFF